MTMHVVRSGEDVMSIAHASGCDPDAVWNHPNNADLKKLRKSPNILCSGDVLFLPDPPPRKWLPVSVGATNKFKGSPLTFSVSLKFAQHGKAMAGVACIVHGLAPPNQLATDGAGMLALTLPIGTREVVVEFPSIPFVRNFRVGHLDPVGTESGLRQRLRNLGHHPSRHTQDYVDQGTLQQSISDFQKASNLEVTGEMNADTAAALEAAHGA